MPMSSSAQPAFETACELVERILAACQGLSAAQLDAVPWGDASSLFVLATHSISGIEWNIVEVLGGQPVDRSRQAEFDSSAAAVDDPLGLLAGRWDGARSAIESALESLPDEAWEGSHYHQFMDRHLSGYELIDRAIAHTAEHVGHAEMTRQWIDAQ